MNLIGLDPASRPLQRFHRLALVILLAGCGQTPESPAAGAGGAETSRTTAPISEMSAPALRDALASGDLSAAAVTDAYLDQIAALDDDGPHLNAIIEINPDARAIAAALDADFLRSGAVGPLHGVPVVLKANIDTGDQMATSAGSIALAAHRAQEDAFLVARLREAGAVILAKTNLSEWANFRDNNSSSGWSSLGGQTRNPHVLDRNPCGSSSGSAVAIAARLAPLAVGTETNGSIVCPAGMNGIVGIKPSLGLVSRRGIIPIAASQDTPGPMASDVSGAALLLESLAAADPDDPVSLGTPVDAPNTLSPARFVPDPDLRRLDGLRIGILRSYFGAGDYPEVEDVYQRAVDRLVSLGAEIVDPIEHQRAPEARQAEFEVLLHEFKVGLRDYLADQRPLETQTAVRSLAELIIFNDAHRGEVMPIFGQSVLIEADSRGGLDAPVYLAALEASQTALQESLSGLFRDHQIDALFHPVNGPAWKTDWVAGDRYSFGGTAYLAAVSGYPSIALPAGVISGLPVAVGFTGLAYTDARIIQMAYAFEQSLGLEIRPTFIPSIEVH